MSALARLQARFLQGVLEDRPLAAGDVRGTPAFSVEQRLAVYANAYRRRLVEALASGFEKTATALGADAFEALALAYVEANPPRDRALGRHADGFPDWLAHHAEGGSGIADLARIEQGLQRAFEAADAPAVDRTTLLALPVAAWTGLRFAWVPALAIGQVEAAAIGRWREPKVAATADRESSITAVAFWRRDGQTFFRSMAPGEALLLERLRSGATLADACTNDAGAIPLDVAVPAVLTWIDDGWVAALDVGNDAA